MSYQVANSKIILAISNFFNISKECSIYIYYRFKRSLRKPNDKKYLFYSIQFQNALVRADKTLGIDWLTLDFANELCTLEKNGIDIEEQDNKVFRWGVIDIDVVDVDQVNSWQTVSHKKIRSTNKNIVAKFGLFV